MYSKDYVMRLLIVAKGDTHTINRILDAAGPLGDFTLEEIGNVLGITRERVRQIETKAMQKLRHPKLGKSLKRYVDMSEHEDICNLVGE